MHRIGLRVDNRDVIRFAAIGVNLTPGLTALVMADDDPKWFAVSRLVEEMEAVDITSPKYSSRELAQADYLEVVPQWHHGYPQPENDSEYKRASYDLSLYCEECGVGKVQKAPLRMRSEPKWGTRSILQMHWIYDEYFVTPQAWEDVFSPFGVPFLPAVQNRGGRTLESVVQLDLRERVHVDLSGLVLSSCSACDKAKYEWPTKGFMPKPKQRPHDAMFKSHEWFGSGGSGGQMVFVSAALYARIKEAKLKGASFWPCAK